MKRVGGTLPPLGVSRFLMIARRAQEGLRFDRDLRLQAIRTVESRGLAASQLKCPFLRNSWLFSASSIAMHYCNFLFQYFAHLGKIRKAHIMPNMKLRTDIVIS